MDVLAMTRVILWIADAMVGKALLPDEKLETQFLLGAKRKSAFDELNGLFQRNIFRGPDDQMEVVRHDHEFVQKKAAFPAIVREDVEKQPRHFFFLKSGSRPWAMDVTKNVRISSGGSRMWRQR
jgi:hypothetical protein